MERTPEEVKKGLECCSVDDLHCGQGCPYKDDCLEEARYKGLESDALALIQRLEEDQARLECTITQLSGTIRNYREAESSIPRWISAKEPPKKWRLDDNEKTLINFLIYSPEFGVDVGNYLEPAKNWVLFGVPGKITHWMDITSLPAIPEEE